MGLYYEFRERSWEMCFEGTSDDKPTEKELKAKAEEKGYKLEDIDIFYDDMTQVWRFCADLVKN